MKRYKNSFRNNMLEYIQTLSGTIVLRQDVKSLGSPRQVSRGLKALIEDGILDGDYVVIEKVDRANNGEIVVALVDDNLATLKKFYKEGDTVVLKPANSQMMPIYPKTLRIQGRVVGLVRKF